MLNKKRSTGDKAKHIPWSEMLNSLTGKSVKSRYLQLTVGYRFNL